MVIELAFHELNYTTVFNFPLCYSQARLVMSFSEVKQNELVFLFVEKVKNGFSKSSGKASPNFCVRDGGKSPPQTKM